MRVVLSQQVDSAGGVARLVEAVYEDYLVVEIWGVVGCLEAGCMDVVKQDGPYLEGIPVRSGFARDR